MPNCPYHLVVQHDTDIITMRQEVRQIARALGLSLRQQATICAAASGIARSFLTLHTAVSITVQLIERSGRSALEIVSAWPDKQVDEKYLETLLDLERTRFLVNEALVAVTPAGPQIVLRVWLLS